MKPINLISDADPSRKILIECWSRGFGLGQTEEILNDGGYQATMSIITAFNKALDAQCEHDIGHSDES